jgi:hypothetical protein
MPQDSPATPIPTAAPADEALQTFIDKIKELDLVIKRRLKKLDDWGTWSDEARTAFSHLIAAEILSSKASDIRIDHAIAFEEDHQSAFDELVAILKKRRRSTSVKPASDKSIDQ